MIRTTAGGFARGGYTSSSRKAHAWRHQYKEVFSPERPPKQVKLHTTIAISFDDEDCEGVIYPHDDALMGTLLVANYTTRRVLINNDSSVDILL